MQKISLTLDGKHIEGSPGQTILDVAKEHGIYIPTLCYHPRTGQAGNCRLCLVEIEGRADPVISCSTAIQQGMVVQTESERIIEARKVIVELYLSSGSHNCLICESCGRCELQEIAYKMGIESSPFPQAPTSEIDDSSPFIIKDMNRCIRCGRCIRGCQEIVVNEVLAMGNRGSEAAVVVDDDRPFAGSSCVFCGECVQLCPVGALIEKKSKGKGRPWETTAVRTTCPYCGVGCQIDLHVMDNEITRVTGAEEVEPNYGSLCLKGRFAFDFVSHPERLKEPLVRKEGSFVAVSWDEALDCTAQRLKQIRDKHGPDALAGISCARTTNENNYAMMKFMRAAAGTNNIDHCART
jgi:predicted molibdopterin-dependent oxidoreductase YjgC